MRHFVLRYRYVDDYLVRREAERPRHLALAQAALERGELLLAGAFAEPPFGATLVFRGETRDVVDAFVRADPYVAAGIVTEHEVRELNVALSAFGT